MAISRSSISKQVSTGSGRRGKDGKISTGSSKRNYRSEYDNYHASKEQKDRRNSRNKARRVAVKAGKAVAGKDVAHRNGNPKDNKVSNLKTQAKGKNRSFARTKTARKKNPKS
jgi:hypothetical protein